MFWVSGQKAFSFPGRSFLNKSFEVEIEAFLSQSLCFSSALLIKQLIKIIFSRISSKFLKAACAVNELSEMKTLCAARVMAVNFYSSQTAYELVFGGEEES